MRDWMKLAEQLEEPEQAGVNRVVRAEIAPETPIHPIRSIHPAPLPPDCNWSGAVFVVGLRHLETMPVPSRLAHPEIWPGVVADALWLADSGHATQALTLGWSERELFGFDPRLISIDYGGLATHLEGRRQLLLDGQRAVIGEGIRRSVIERRLMETRQFLWEPIR